MKPAALFALAALLEAAPAYIIVDLSAGPLASSTATGINNAGHAAGYGTTWGGSTLGLEWSSGGFTVLGSGYGLAINDAGTIAGVAFTAGGARAMAWNGSGGAFLGTLGGESWATAINHAGTIAGMSVNGGGAGQAFVWSNGVMTGLPVAAGWSAAYGINGAGVVAGYAEVRPGVFAAFTWSPEEGVRWLDFAYGLAINDAGAVAGATAQGRAALRIDGRTVDLGPGFACAVNNAGAVVGHDGGRAFLWAGGVRYDLNTLIDPRSGWTLVVAYAINDRGQIAGQGWHEGVLKAFRLDPVLVAPAAAFDGSPVPEPGPPWLSGAGFALGVFYLRVFRNSRMSRLTSSGASCSVQWPTPGSRTFFQRFGTLFSRLSTPARANSTTASSVPPM